MDVLEAFNVIKKEIYNNSLYTISLCYVDSNYGCQVEKKKYICWSTDAKNAYITVFKPMYSIDVHAYSIKEQDVTKCIF